MNDSGLRRAIARLSLVATVLLAPSVADAQSKPVWDADGSIVVTASRIDNATDVAVTDRAAIERRQASSLLDLLDDVPGVRAFSTGGPAGGSFLSIRGGEPNFTVVLIDGIRLNDPTNSQGGAFDFMLLDPSAVERVEVLRSAASAVHGSDALSGVVQIITRPPTRTGVDAAAQGWIDSNYGGNASANLSGGWGSGGARVSGGYFDSGDGNPAGTLRRSHGLARARQQIGGFSLNAIGLYADTDGTAYPQDSGGPLLANNRQRELRHGSLAVAGLSLTRDRSAVLRPSLSFNRSLQRGDSDSPAIAPGALGGVPATVASTRFERIEAIAAIVGDLGRVTASAGGVFLREDGRSDGFLDVGFPLPTRFARVRTTYSGFAEASAALPAGFSVSGALRYDRQAGNGNWTGRGGIGWSTGVGGPRFNATVTTGYKLPSLFAIGHPLIGNPALQPERSRTVALGMEWPFQQGHASVTLYDNRYNDLIDFDPVAFRLVNRARVGTRGADADVAVRLASEWSLAAAGGYLAIDSPTPLRGRPAWKGNMRLTWERRRWQATAAVRANSAFNDSSIPTGARVTAGHVEADVGIRYTASDYLTLRLTLLNLGDNRSWDAVGTPRPGRSLRLTIVVE
ncbi:MAG: TonB-dependent receptor [Sphingomonas sp.]|uniref:TonB-dependent receptor plug domain-containing protein n=1 Tax=Sphingomonas sp. TaxID=28214 RepID=UPI0035A8CC23|nr:TonB-dependent receptor [Sphingomonas sp.]